MDKGGLLGTKVISARVNGRKGEKRKYDSTKDSSQRLVGAIALDIH